MNNDGFVKKQLAITDNIIYNVLVHILLTLAVSLLESRKPMKNAFSVIKTVLVWSLVIFAVCFAVFTLISLRTVDVHNREVFGFKAMIVRSDSMSATDFSAGDLILVKEWDVNDLEVGDIISFKSQNSYNYGEILTHKIKAIDYHQNGTPVFITYGTTTGAVDESPVMSGFVLGKYMFAIPKLGYFFNFLKTPKGYFTLILVPLLIIMGSALWNAFRNVQGVAAEDAKSKEMLTWEEKKTYLSMIDDLRRQNEDMHREMKELRTMVSRIPGVELPPEETVEPVSEEEELPEVNELDDEAFPELEEDDLPDLNDILAEFDRL